MASIQVAEVVHYCVEVVDCGDSVGLAVHLQVLLDVKALGGEVNFFAYFFLLANLGVSQVEETGLARVCCLFL